MINIATLKAMFRLYDGYSTTIDKVNRKTDEATNKILKASGSTDKFNKKLEQTGASAGKASGGLGKFISLATLTAGAIKGMSIADEFTNTSARLDLINDGSQTQLELQEKIFAAANRSKGLYSEMAGAISKMGLLAGDAFTSNDELIAFTELVQKGFKVGGADTSEQQGAMRQLSQAMASGRLMGDELVSIMENAPMIYNAIAKYTGLTKGELKEVSSDGAITADIIKNAMFMAGDDINEKFATMPMTFADVWTKIKNGGLKAFDTVIAKVNKLINTEGFQTGVNNVIAGINLLATGIGWLLDISAQYWDFIGPVLAAIGGYLLVGIITKLWAMIPPLMLQGALWTMITSPIFLVILAIGLVMAALNAVGVTTEEVFGFIGGTIGWLIGAFANAGIAISNSFISIMDAVEKVVFGAINLIIKGVNLIIDALNKIPGVNIGSVNELSGYWGNKELIDYVNLSDASKKGSDIGKNIYNSGKDKLSSLTNPFGDFGTSNNPLTIEGKGKNKKVDVDMSDEDLQYLRDVAERDYINKFSTATLAPNIEISFGDVHEAADVDKVHGRIRKILQEEIAIAAEGAY
ncbi:tape measure protein [Tissierella sp.]|uniref:tape measure protein n=1 Tax=Tissierella sp. TaxID=41274 RepID=UPI002866694C|nr:tape measure protein [Tissierella sp.]MDR7856300.1 tape measure protein [Tissierella sp.]